MKKLSFLFRSISITTIIFVFLFLIYHFVVRDKTDIFPPFFTVYPDSTIITINGMPVPEAEFRLHLNRNIAMTYNYFSQKHNASDHADFWETSYVGEVPLEYIKTKTLGQLIHIKTLQKLAIDEGVIPGFDYDDFLGWWKEDNRERKAKYEAGEIVFGPIQSSVEDYYDYLFSNLVIKLKDKLNQTGFEATDSELKSHYEMIKEKYFRYTPAVEIAYLEFPYQTSSQMEETLEQALAARKSVLEGEALKSLTAKLISAGYGRSTYSDTMTIIGEDNPDHERRKLALQLQPDDVEVFNSKENSAVYLIQCLNRSPEKIYSFTNMKQDVLWYYQKARYDELLSRLKQSAVVRINQPLFQSIIVR